MSSPWQRDTATEAHCSRCSLHNLGYDYAPVALAWAPGARVNPVHRGGRRGKRRTPCIPECVGLGEPQHSQRRPAVLQFPVRRSRAEPAGAARVHSFGGGASPVLQAHQSGVPPQRSRVHPQLTAGQVQETTGRGAEAFGEVGRATELLIELTGMAMAA